KVARRGEWDFVTGVAAELPLRGIAGVLGVSQGGCHKLFYWSNRPIGFEGPAFVRPNAGGGDAPLHVYGYAHHLPGQRLREPQDDIVTVLLCAEVDGERLCTPDFNAFFLLLAVAGNETTRNLIAHGMRLLIEHREARERLLADRSLLPSAIEEMLRFSPP